MPMTDAYGTQNTVIHNTSNINVYGNFAHFEVNGLIEWLERWLPP